MKCPECNSDSLALALAQVAVRVHASVIADAPALLAGRPWLGLVVTCVECEAAWTCNGPNDTAPHPGSITSGNSRRALRREIESAEFTKEFNLQ